MQKDNESLESLVGSGSGAVRADCSLTELDDQVEISYETAHAKLKRIQDQIQTLEINLQRAVNENAKLKVKQTKNAKLWLELDSKLSSANTMCDQLFETLKEPAGQTQQVSSPKELPPHIWYACGGPAARAPHVGSLVYYFPEGHLEQCASLPSDLALTDLHHPFFLCSVTSVHLLIDPNSDEVYSVTSLNPITSSSCHFNDYYSSTSPPQTHPALFSSKVLSKIDVKNGGHGGLSVPRDCAESIFPPLERDTLVQTLTMCDVYGKVFEFKHTYCGTPRKRHLLTTGWSGFVEDKKLVTGDTVVFIRNGNDLLVGVRRGPRYIKSQVVVKEVLDALEATTAQRSFEVKYFPRNSDATRLFVVEKEIVERALLTGYWSAGVKVKLAIGTAMCHGIVSTVLSKPFPWLSSPWRALQVIWDDSRMLQSLQYVSPWDVKINSLVDNVIETPYVFCEPVVVYVLQNATTQSLFRIVNRILDESIEREKGEIPHRVVYPLRKVVQEIERRISTQSEHIRNRTCDAQREQIQTPNKRLEDQIAAGKELQSLLDAAKQKLQLADSSRVEAITQFKTADRTIRDLREQLARAEARISEGEVHRKKLHNTILELKGNIRVFCRVRPFITDGNGHDGSAISYPASTDLVGRGIDLANQTQKYSFTFDRVFGPDSSQEDVFVEISQLVQSALDGYRVCIFAYGQTGSGKTYTMMGRQSSEGEKGMIPRSLHQIFKTTPALTSKGWEYCIQASMLEIYNETIRDLLLPGRPGVGSEAINSKQYNIKHDANGNTIVSDLTILDVHSQEDVDRILRQAEQSRSVGRTRMNEQSSRSHCVFTLRISGINKKTEQQVQGVLNLIDLAGSERLAKSGATGDRLKETQAINRSLSALGDVISSLAKKEDHVPFRNSKLTYLLQPCLGGDSKNLMFVTTSPEVPSADETLSSLRFAARVNSCEIGVSRRRIY